MHWKRELFLLQFAFSINPYLFDFFYFGINHMIFKLKKLIQILMISNIKLAIN